MFWLLKTTCKNALKKKKVRKGPNDSRKRSKTYNIFLKTYENRFEITYIAQFNLIIIIYCYHNRFIYF